MTTTIPLTQGQETIVSDVDADLAGLRWYAAFHGSYGGGGAYLAQRGEQQKTVCLHRVILSRMLGRELRRNEQVDHINQNPLDNRRENLRLATSSQNLANRGMHSNNQSGFKGVSFYKRLNKYAAFIRVNRKAIYLGLYPTPQEAHEAYKQAAREHFGEFARFE